MLPFLTKRTVPRTWVRLAGTTIDGFGVGRTVAITPGSSIGSRPPKSPAVRTPMTTSPTAESAGANHRRSIPAPTGPGAARGAGLVAGPEGDRVRSNRVTAPSRAREQD